MSTIKSLDVSTGVNLSGLSSGLKGAGSKITSFGASLPKMGGAGAVAFGSVIGNGITGAITGAMSSIKSVIGSGFKGAIDAESIETSFGVLLKSTDKAKEVIKDLQKFGATTPFEFPGIADSAKNLLSFGVSTEDLMPTLTNLGNVASGLNIPFNEMSEIYGKIKVSQTVYNEDLNQLAGRGIPVFTELAKVMGVSSTQIKKMSSEGKIEFKHIEKMFQNLSASGGQFEGMMEKQSATLGGLMSTLSDSFNMGLVGITTKIIETFDIKGKVSAFISILSDIPIYIEYVGAVMASIKPIIDQLIATSIASFQFFGEVIGSVFSYFSSTIGGSLGSFESWINNINFGLTVVEYAFKNWQDYLRLSVTNALLNLVSFGADLKHLFVTTIPIYFSYLAKNGYDIFNNLVTNITALFRNLSSNIVAVFKNIPGLLSGSVNWSDVWKPISTGMVTVMKDIPDIPQRVMGDMEKSLMTERDRINQKLTQGMQKKLETKFKVDASGQLAAIKAPTAIPAAPTAIAAPGSPATPTAVAATADKKENTLAEVGSSEARKSLVSFFNKSYTGSKDPVDIAKEQLAIQKQQLAELKKSKTESVKTEKVVNIAG